MIKKVICICLIAVILIPGIACALPLDNTYLPEEIRLLIQKEETLDGFELVTADDESIEGISDRHIIGCIGKRGSAVSFLLPGKRMRDGLHKLVPAKAYIQQRL